MPDSELSSAGQIVAPYITSWSEEGEPLFDLIERPGVGLGYLDEVAGDRDQHGVLWCRSPLRHRVGRPLFGATHPLRQRRAMRKLLCQVCGGPADQNEDGVLFLLRDFRDDWPDWPNRMGIDEPPVCVPCVSLATRLCPALRKGAVAFRACRCEIVGVTGRLYTGGLVPKKVGSVTVTFEDPAVRWVVAMGLVREVLDCTVIEVDELAGVSACRS